MAHALLFEIGTEELPPSELPAILRALGEAAEKALAEAWLAFDIVRVYATPRRLAIVMSGLAEQQESRRVTVTGPPRKAAYDAAGKPTKAAQGFARAQGVAVEALITVQTDRGEYLAAERSEGGRPARDVLPELLERLAVTLPFAKQMRWGTGEARFSRPIRWIVALLDSAVLPVTVAGIAAGRATYGHRFLHPGALEIARPEEYVERLASAVVIADVDARRDRVRSAVTGAVAHSGLRAVVDDDTLEAVLHLVEAPTAIVGSFPDAYLKLPRVVIETPIRHHQKCFPVENAQGDLAAVFVTVSNMPGVDPVEIRRGNERVIRARLADADFYFREDLKTSPDDRLPALRGMVFQDRLGTLWEKTERLVALAESFHPPAETARILGRAALLAKSDLASGMVREFPELQGIMGEEYVRRAGGIAAVAQAIREHYLPRYTADALPASLPGALLSVADKLDTVVGCIGVGLMPTGSQDPYALRRHAQGMLACMETAIASGVPLSLGALVDTALGLLAAKLSESAPATRARSLEFFRGRLATMLVARGARADVVDAVLASTAGYDDPVDVRRRVDAVTTLRERADWEPLGIAFKRAINILPPGFSGAVDETRLVDEAERRLHAETKARMEAVMTSRREGGYVEALAEIAGLRPAVDAFFDAVMVMDEDPAIRDNRLALLTAIVEPLLSIADLRKIQATT